MDRSSPPTIHSKSSSLGISPIRSPKRCHPWESVGNDEVTEEVTASTKFRLVGEGDKCLVFGRRKALQVERDYVEVYVEKSAA